MGQRRWGLYILVTVSRGPRWGQVTQCKWGAARSNRSRDPRALTICRAANQSSDCRYLTASLLQPLSEDENTEAPGS